MSRQRLSNRIWRYGRVRTSRAGNSAGFKWSIIVGNTRDIGPESYTDNGVDVVSYVGSARDGGSILIAVALTKTGNSGGGHVAEVATNVHGARGGDGEDD